MKDKGKTKEQLLAELAEMRKQVRKLGKDRRRLKMALREPEEKFGVLLENSLDIIQIVDSEGIIRYTSPSIERILGYNPDELIGRASIEGVHPDDLEMVAKGFEEAIQRPGTPVVTVCRWKHKDGTWRVLEGTGVNHLDDPVIEGFILNIHDITEHKQAEEELHFIGSIAGQVSDSIIVTDTNYKIAYINEAAEELFGYSREELAGKSPDILNAETAAEQIQEDIYRTVSSGGTWFGTMLNRRKDGSTFVNECKVSPLLDKEGRIVSYIGIQRDVTEQRRTQRTLEESQLRFTQIVENIQDVLWVGGPGRDGGIQYLSPAFEQVWGIRPEKIYEDTQIVWDSIHSEDREEFAHIFDKHISEGSPYEAEYRIARPDGSIRWIATRGFPVKDETGNVCQEVGIAHDITDRKQAEQQLRESEEKFKHLAEQSPNMIFINKKDNVVYANKQCEEVMGYQREEFYSPDFDFLTLIAPESKELLKASYSRHMMGKDVAPYEYALVTKNGERLEAIITTKLIEYEGENAILGIVTDITERKRTELELQRSHEELRNLYKHLQSAREEERAAIARGVHDELAQDLTALKIDLSWLRRRLTKDNEPLLARTEDMSKLVDTAIQKVQRIYTELRPGVLDDLGLVPAIQWQVDEFRDRTGIECKLALEVEDFVLGRDQAINYFRILQEALTNISRHAGATRARINLKRKADNLVLEIRDNGKGITQRQLHSHWSFGLMGMRERANSIGSTLNIRGAADKGTTVTLIVPTIPKGVTE
jgi:PAS domain S-box-containing protein